MLDQNNQQAPVQAAPQQPQPQEMPQASPVAEVPASPEEASGLSQEEMKANLQDLMSKIDSKYEAFSRQNFSNKNTQNNSGALAMFFDMLKQAGVDPSNVEEVNAFLENIRQNNPEIFKKVEAILKALIEGGDTLPEEGEQTPAEQITPEMGTTTPESNMNI